MAAFFYVLIVPGVIFFGACIVIGIKAMIDEINNPQHDRSAKFREWLKREDKSVNFPDWLRKNYPDE